MITFKELKVENENKITACTDYDMEYITLY